MRVTCVSPEGLKLAIFAILADSSKASFQDHMNEKPVNLPNFNDIPL